MSSWQTRAARAMLTLAFAITAYAKLKAVATDLPDQSTIAQRLAGLAAGFECVVAALLWTRFSVVACWAGASFVSVGSLLYPLLAGYPGEGCGCAGAVHIGPLEHAGLGLSLFALCSLLILNRQQVAPATVSGG